jgi:redox-sensitive bicupin YhaK (pirin superfamily)
MKNSSRRFFLWGFATLAVSCLVKGLNLAAAKIEKGGVMLTVRKSSERGVGAHGWLNSQHSFSFANYYDPKHMGFRSLRVINEDRIEGGTGFGAHPHNDMEIISYVVSGALEHSDSMGTKAVIRPGEVQRMSAASGVVHSEYNKLPEEQAHFFQIWIQPNKIGGAPGYGQKSFEEALNKDKLVLVVSENGRDGSIDIKQDADIYISRLKAGENVDFKLRPQRGAWVQVVKGSLSVNGTDVNVGDAVSVNEEALLTFKAKDQSEFILFDLA